MNFFETDLIIFVIIKVTGIRVLVEMLRGGKGLRLHFGETETPFCRGVTMTPRNVPGGSRATSPPWVTQGDALKVCR